MNEAELLFTHILDCDYASLYRDKNKVLAKDKLELISSVLKRRLSGEPLQYILGKTEFMGFEFKVNPAVLIPRPETEVLVETALEYLKDKNSAKGSVKVLDLCTGSGCIAISLAKNLSGVLVDASDLSADALRVAGDNASLNKVSINLIQSDLFKSDLILQTSYDMIISNPPYVSRGEFANLQPEVQKEPRMALDGGFGGLDFYKRIIQDAYSYLKNDGLLIFEIGFGQLKGLEDIFIKSGLFNIIKVVKDYNNIERVIVSRKVEKNG
jgi:release factor glutamine methyltransferase